MVLYIIITNISGVPAVFKSIFTEAFNLRAGIGALAGIAIIGARRAALVNDAGIGTASIMHGASRNESPVREGLIRHARARASTPALCARSTALPYFCAAISTSKASRDSKWQCRHSAQRHTRRRHHTDVRGHLLRHVLDVLLYSFYGTTCANYLFVISDRDSLSLATLSKALTAPGYAYCKLVNRALRAFEMGRDLDARHHDLRQTRVGRSANVEACHLRGLPCLANEDTASRRMISWFREPVAEEPYHCHIAKAFRCSLQQGCKQPRPCPTRTHISPSTPQPGIFCSSCRDLFALGRLSDGAKPSVNQWPW